ncbi:MAG: ABC transporter permease [Actinomycetota bacterium]|nr:ABC transporter permease [Actinomycetota bacterium]
MARFPALRATEYFAVAYLRTWRGTVMTTFLNPVLYLAAMGVGLGTFVNRGPHASALLGHVSYLDFVGPALVASTAMQTAATESTFPVMAAIKWRRTYEGMLATPLSVGDVIIGHFLWIATRIFMAVTVYLVVLVAFGAARSPLVVLVVPAGLLTGLAFTGPLVAFAASQENDNSFPMVFRLGLIPLFLFSGTFFPLSQLPSWLHIVAYCTPLWHGVELCRSFALGTAGFAASLIHATYLVVLAAAGLAVASVTYRRRLVT